MVKLEDTTTFGGGIIMLNYMRILWRKDIKQRGSAYIMTLILLTVVGVLVAAYLTTSQATTSIAHRQLDQKLAFWAAEAGLEHLRSMNFDPDDGSDSSEFFELKADLNRGGSYTVRDSNGDNIIYDGEDNTFYLDLNIEVDDPPKTVTFESEGRYNRAFQKIRRDVILEKGEWAEEIENPWNLEGSPFVDDSDFFVKDIKAESGEVRFGVRDDELVDEEGNPIDDINYDKKASKNNVELEVNFVDDSYNRIDQIFYFDIKFDDVSGQNEIEYVDVTFSLEEHGNTAGVRVYINSEDEIVDIFNLKLIEEINERVHGDHADIVLGMFSFKDYWPDEDYKNDMFDPTTTSLDEVGNNIIDEIIVSEGNSRIDQNYIDNSRIYIKGDLEISGASALEIKNSLIFVEGNLNLTGVPNLKLNDSSFFIQGEVTETGQTKFWYDNIDRNLDSGDIGSNIKIEWSFSNWRIY